MKDFRFLAAFAGLFASSAAMAGYGYAPAVAIAPDPIGAGAVQVVDLDVDGLDDILLLTRVPGESGFGRILFFRQLPGGRLASPVTIEHGLPMGQSSSLGLLVADVDGDARPDLVLSHVDATGSRLRTLLNEGGGTWRAVTTPLAAYLGGVVGTDDIDGDGHLDLVAAGGSNGYGGRWVFGAGDGSFGQVQELPMPFHNDRMFLADVDNDGRKDLVYARWGTVAARLNTGSGFSQFESVMVTQSTDYYDLRTLPGDFNGDGRTDLLAGRGINGGVLSLYPQHDWGGYRLRQTAGRTPYYLTAMHAVDLDGDGRDDLVAWSDYSLQVAMGQPRGLGPASNFAMARATALAFGDVDGDGFGDIVAVGQNGGVSYLPGRPDFFDGDLAIQVGLVPRAVAVRVDNLGTSTSPSDVRVRVKLSARLAQPLLGALPVTCSNRSWGGTIEVDCRMPTLSGGGHATVVLPIAPGNPDAADTITASANLSSSWLDLRNDNDSALMRVRVAPGD